jgi:hypothetical protein
LSTKELPMKRFMAFLPLIVVLLFSPVYGAEIRSGAVGGGGSTTITGSYPTIDFTVKSLTSAKQSGVAGRDALYEANSTDTSTAGYRGPLSLSYSYEGQLPNTRAGASNQALCWTNAGETGTGTDVDPYVQTLTWCSVATLTGVETLSGKTLTAPSLGSSYLSTTKTVGASSTTANLLVKIDTSGTVVTASTSDVGILGVAVSTVTTGNPVEIATRGIINCIADNTTVIGNIAIVGTSTGGRCRDSGQSNSTAIPLTTQIVGKFLSVATVGNAASLQLYGPGHYGSLASCVPTEIDAHTAQSPTATQLAACNATSIHNYNQAASDINNTLPATAANLGFTATVSTAQGSNYWRFTAASAGTIYLNGSATGKNYVQYTTPVVGAYFSCFTANRANAYVWYCSDGVGSLATN